MADEKDFLDLSLDQFRTEMFRIYGEFTHTADLEERGIEGGITPAPFLTDGETLGGYIVALRHPIDVAKKVEAFAERIAGTVSGVAYDASVLHTTLVDHCVSPNFSYDAAVMQTLNHAVMCVNNMVVGKAQSPNITYDRDWRVKSDSVIVAGKPDEQFLTIAQTIVHNARSLKENVRGAWGSHLTAVRFTEPKQPSELEDLYALMKEAPDLGTSKPPRLEVGHFTLNEEGFDLYIPSNCYRFDLQ